MIDRFLEYIHLFLSILAGIAYILIGIALGQDAMDTLYRLIFIIIGSYIVGLILRRFLRKTVVKPKPAPEEQTLDAAVGIEGGEALTTATIEPFSELGSANAQAGPALPPELDLDDFDF